MGHNRAGDKAKARAKRRRREQTRLAAKASVETAAQPKIPAKAPGM